MAEGGGDPLSSSLTRNSPNFFLPLDDTDSVKTLRGNAREKELSSVQRDPLVHATTPPDRYSGVDSFYNRVTPPDGHSRMREFQTVDRRLVVNVSEDELSLKSFTGLDTEFSVDTGPADPDAKCNIGASPGGHPYFDDKYASDAVSSVVKIGLCTTQRSYEYSWSDECTKHEGEPIKYVCLSCNNALLCQVCLSLKHLQCKQYEFINNVVKDPEFGFENKCAKFEEELNYIDKSLKSNNSKLTTNANLVETIKQRALADLKNHRERLNRRFDQLEKQFETEVTKLEKDDYNKLVLLNSKVVGIQNEFNNVFQDFHQRKVEGKRARVFTRIQWSQESIDVLKERLACVESENKVLKYRYIPSETMDKLFDDGVKIAEANEEDSKVTSGITNVSNISVSHGNDSNKCKITGLALLGENYLIAADSNNSAIKIVDTERECLEARHGMSSQPLDVTVIPSGSKAEPQVVVTFPKECTIGFFDGNIETFTKINEITTNGKCRSVVHSNGKLIVTFPNQGKIEIMTTSGTFLRRITNDTIGQSVFQPEFVAVDISRTRLYVSDRDTHGIWILGNEGAIQNLYTSVDMVEPRGVCVNDTGAVFACSLAQHQVHHLSDNGEFVSNVDMSNEDHLAPFPHSIVYCNDRRILYVGQLAYDCIKAFRIDM